MGLGASLSSALLLRYLALSPRPPLLPGLLLVFAARKRVSDHGPVRERGARFGAHVRRVCRCVRGPRGLRSGARRVAGVLGRPRDRRRWQSGGPLRRLQEEQRGEPRARARSTALLGCAVRDDAGRAAAATI